MSYLTEDKLNEFKENGYVVIENIFNDEGIENIRNNFHQTLLKYDINHDSIFSGNYDDINNNVRKKSNVSKIFYEKWKFDATINQNMYLTFKDLLLKTFGSKNSDEMKIFFDNEIGVFDDVLPYIDRVCYRLPDHIREEGGLSLHIDRNPFTYKFSQKIRPVQAFITLTDHYGLKSGGLRLVPKFHKNFNNYFISSPETLNDKGEFFRMHGKEHVKIYNKLITVEAPKGSLIIWDNRLPHATCYM
jgi:ectoine hydroxylase-related dioxygenase (phytanoyl-CoA dioxygenase family)